MDSSPLGSTPSLPSHLSIQRQGREGKGRGGKRKLAAHATFTSRRTDLLPGLGHPHSRDVLSQAFGKVTPSGSSPSKSLCFSAAGVVWASITTPEHRFFTREMDLTTAVQEPNKEMSARQASEEIPLLWMLAAPSGADHNGRPAGNQTPPGSIQARPGDKPGTKVSIRQTAVRATLIKVL